MHRSIVNRSSSRALLIAAVLMAATLAYSLGSLASVARAEGPGNGTPYTVSLGDSFISGEAGRWAGNTNESSSKTAALGSTAYYDNSSGTGELIKGCHRSKSAEVYIGGAGVSTVTFTEVVAIVSEADASIGQIPQNHYANVEEIRLIGTEAQKTFFFDRILKGDRLGNAAVERSGKNVIANQTRLVLL